MVTRIGLRTKKFKANIGHAGAELRPLMNRVVQALVMDGPSSWDMHPDVLKWNQNGGRLAH